MFMFQPSWNRLMFLKYISCLILFYIHIYLIWIFQNIFSTQILLDGLIMF